MKPKEDVKILDDETIDTGLSWTALYIFCGMVRNKVSRTSASLSVIRTKM